LAPPMWVRAAAPAQQTQAAPLGHWDQSPPEWARARCTHPADFFMCGVRKRGGFNEA